MQGLYTYNAKVLEVIDGDTFIVSLDLGLEISKICRIRVLGLDTPEKFAKNGNVQEKELGNICKAYAEKTLLNKDVVVKTNKNSNGKLYDSFGRVLADIYIDGNSWTDILTALGVNKYAENYSAANVLKLKQIYIDFYCLYMLYYIIK